jgi:hypothetical protein
MITKVSLVNNYLLLGKALRVLNNPLQPGRVVGVSRVRLPNSKQAKGKK